MNIQITLNWKHIICVLLIVALGLWMALSRSLIDILETFYLGWVGDGVPDAAQFERFQQISYHLISFLFVVALFFLSNFNQKISMNRHFTRKQFMIMGVILALTVLKFIFTLLGSNFSEISWMLFWYILFQLCLTIVPHRSAYVECHS